MPRKLPSVLFTVLSLSWGLPMTLCGAVVMAILRIRGYAVKRFGACRYVEIGEKWGGLSLGMFFFCEAGQSEHLRIHEAGHSVQNIMLGPLMPLLVTIPSAIRYHLRRRAKKRGRLPRGRYENVWFEAWATALGQRYFAQHPTSE